MTAPLDTDLAIIGSGFGGSLLAMIARRLGLRVALLERGVHPRFAIGESASPLAGVIIEQLAARYDLPRLTPLATYGAWRRAYPHITCGLKRGFTYFKHADGQPFHRRSDRANELLVAASPSDELSDTHWLRADVDQFLMQEAVALGADYIDELALNGIDWRADAVLLSGERRGNAVAVRARFVVDATGPRGFLSRVLKLDAPGFPGYPPTQALYSHFTGVARCADMPEFATGEPTPYPMDAAALHHVFDGGWMWVLRFDNGVASAGVAVTDSVAAELRLADGERAWHRLLVRYPSVAAQFADARPIREFTWMPRLAWRSSVASGDRWAMLPSAAAFVDPLFSTGIPLTLLGVERLAARMAAADISTFARDADTAGIAGNALLEVDHTARFIAGCYAAFPRFQQFTAWSMFYFAAASFSEMSRRVHGDAWSRGFLLAHDERFVAAMRELSPVKSGAAKVDLKVDLYGGEDGRDGRAGADLKVGLYGCEDDDGVYERCVAAAIEAVNVAGLAAGGKRNWYGVDVEDTVRAAHKLDANPDAIRRLFAAPVAGA